MARLIKKYEVCTSFLLFSLFQYVNMSKIVAEKIVFPENFKFGVSTSAYQIEGAWNADNKGESIWDKFTHERPYAIKDKSNGDIACNSYYKMKDDLDMLQYLHVDCYRFSLSWARILPGGFASKVNKEGVQYYRNLLIELKKSNIEPFVTIHHFDLPQKLQDIGGWTNPLIINIFGDFARLCFQLFGDIVKNWITINEPREYCHRGYGAGLFAPGINSSGIGEYLCGHYMILSHANVWHIYDKEFRVEQRGKISIAIDSFWYEPASNKIEDVFAAETDLYFHVGWFLSPLVYGNYPQIMIDRIAFRSKLEGYSRSRLPKFTNKDMELIKGTYDFLGLNYYTSFISAAMPEPAIGSPSLKKDAGTDVSQPDEWNDTEADYFKTGDAPWGFRNMLTWTKNTYNNPKILITENGISDSKMQDYVRINYMKTHLKQLKEAMDLDNVRVTHYMAWSLMDVFEWDSGYTKKYGLYMVNFSSPTRKRTPRTSVDFYKNIIETHSFEYLHWK